MAADDRDPEEHGGGLRDPGLGRLGYAVPGGPAGAFDAHQLIAPDPSSNPLPPRPNTPPPTDYGLPAHTGPRFVPTPSGGTTLLSSNVIYDSSGGYLDLDTHIYHPAPTQTPGPKPDLQAPPQAITTEGGGYPQVGPISGGQLGFPEPGPQGFDHYPFADEDWGS